MTEIHSRDELNAALEEGTLLLAYMQKGCVPCASVTPLLSLIDGEADGYAAARLENTGDQWFTDAYSVDGSPTWLVFRAGEETARIDPAGKSVEELHAFLSEELGKAPPPGAIEKALEDGRRQADFVENCLAELMFRSDEAGEDLLLASIRIKVCKACLQSDSPERCVPAQIEYIRERLLARMLTPEGATEARKNALAKLPELSEKCVRELNEVRANAKKQGYSGL